jgi:hypothetical protein
LIKYPNDLKTDFDAESPRGEVEADDLVKDNTGPLSLNLRIWIRDDGRSAHCGIRRITVTIRDQVPSE